MKRHSSKRFTDYAQGQTLANCGGAVCALLLAMPAAAQDAVRASMASAEAAAARRKAASTLGYHNLRLGPTAWRFGAAMGLQYNDNVRYTPDGDADFILSPGITTRMLWPVTERNSLSLALGGGYSFYTINPDLSRWYIDPGSEVSMDFYVGDFWINVHDRFSIEQNAYQDPTVTGVSDYSRLENTAGITTTWDLNKIVLNLNLDHLNYVNLSGETTQPDGQYELASIQAGYALRPGTLVGTQLGAGYIQYSGGQTIYENASQWSAGLFLQSPITQYIQGQASVGYTVYSPSTDLPGVEEDDFSGIYLDVSLNHRVNQYLTHTLAGGRSIQLGFYSGTVDMYYLRWNANWKIVEDLGLGTSFSFESGEQFSGSLEEFDRFGAGINLSRQLGQRLNGTLGYQWYNRTARNTPNDYTVNIVSLNFSYTF